ncbi:MAG: hypothetical protein PW791_08550 [Neorhizobium sp.]|nr:hypothetical protein [Neorhizobium sp.]
MRHGTKPGLKWGLLALPVALYPMLYSTTAMAQSAPLVDVCTGLSVNLPVLQPVTSGLLSILDPLTSLLNTNIVDPLNGANIGVSVLDTNNQVVNTANGCNLATDGVAIEAQTGLSAGGGQLSGLGGAGNGVATAGEVNSIALGNAANTDAAAANAVALGLRGTVTATDGVAVGRDANVSATGGVALGAGSVASRAGMNGATETFSGTAVASTAGAISVGSAGNERQITNVAGGTADTDAVNLRQLRAVNDGLQGQVDTVNSNVSVLQQDVTNISTRVDGMSDSLGGVATALGGGASYNSTTNTFTGPSYTLRGNTYTDVGTALQALNGAIGGAGTNGAVAANNTSGLADAEATGADATAVGYGASANNANSTAIGTGAQTTRDNQIVVGTASNTYTMPGVTSAASRAAQSGATQVLTTDAAGNIATADVDLNQMSSDISSLRRSTSQLRKESRQGIAAAMAMSAAPTPSAPGKTAWGTNLAAYKGEVATSFSVAHMFDAEYPVVVNASVGYAPGGPAGVRVGLSGEF